MNDCPERTYQDAIMAYFDVISRQLSGEGGRGEADGVMNYKTRETPVRGVGVATQIRTGGLAYKLQLRYFSRMSLSRYPLANMANNEDKRSGYKSPLTRLCPLFPGI